MSNIIQSQTPDFSKSYTTWDTPAGFEKASAQLNTALAESKAIPRGYNSATAALANRFQNIDSNVSVRDTYSALDYSFFRPNERTPFHFRDIIAACLGAYQKVPVVRDTIDLMGDFCVQGIKLVHEDEEIQNFYMEWFKRINGEERSERFMNCLYRAGNVIVKRANAELNPSVVADWKRTVASGDNDLDHEEDEDIPPLQVPYRYTIINPLIVEVLGEHMAAFTGKVHYVLKLPSTFYNTLSLPLTSYDPSILTEGLPRDLQQAMDKNEKYLLLDSEKLILLFYKKDDWDVWAYPMLYPLLDEIVLLQKMKQADMTALDGVISHIRIWKLGSLEHKIFPTDAAIAKLSNILLNHLAGGAMDFIWGPDLELTETSTDIAKWLGSEKYEFVMNTIHAGLGVPAAIGKTKGSMSDNFMSIRVILERLQYGRKVLSRFWDHEIKLVQKAMGFKKPAKVYYDNMVLSDEVAEKALWLQLVDRNIVTVEAVQERFGRIPEIENILLMREQKAREAGKMPTKVSPYHDAQPPLSLAKIGMQRGVITPSELTGEMEIDLKEPTPEHQDIIDSTFPDQEKLAKMKKPAPGSKSKPKAKKKGVSGSGRPGGSKDKNKRKARVAKPSSKAEFLYEGEEVDMSLADDFLEVMIYANESQRVIAEVINPFFLEKFDKKTLRSLTAEEGIQLEKFKFNLLYNIPYLDTAVSREVVEDILNDPLEVYNEIEESYKKVAAGLRDRKGEELTVEQCNNIKSYIYAMVMGEFSTENDDEEETK